MNGRRYAALILFELWCWLSLYSHIVGDRRWWDWPLVAVNVASIVLAHWFRRRARTTEDVDSGP